MNTFLWILGSGILMCLIALSGSITLLLKEKTLQKILLPLVAFAAGALIGGAFFHMLPVSIEQIGNPTVVFGIAGLGFVLFFTLEQFLHWHHHSHSEIEYKKPVTYLILIADGLHNFIGGLAVGGVFLIDIKLGIAAWLAAAAHEIPQEMGDFGVLVHGGWKKKKALLFNALAGVTFLAGSLIIYFASVEWKLETSYLIPFGAGNFIYIAASDLIPEVKHAEKFKTSLLHFVSFLSGMLLLFLLEIWLK